MRDDHIIDILENAPLMHLNERQLAAVRAHAAACATCRQAYEATLVSALLVKEYSAGEIEPSPFFHSRVLAAVRERQSTRDAWSLLRLWRAAGALVSSMAAVVVALAVLSFAVPGETDTTENVAIRIRGYTAEEVLLNQTEIPEEQISDGQVVNALYADEDEEAK